MLIEPLLGYKSTLRVLNLLFETPRKPVSRPELFKHTKLGNAPLTKALDRLTHAGILTLENKGKKEFYYINQRHAYASHLYTLWQQEQQFIRNLPYSLTSLLSECVRNLHDHFPNIDQIILFGSHAKGTASARSDIDLAIIFQNESYNELELTRITHQLETQYTAHIQTHIFTLKAFNTQKHKLLKEIKQDGIVIG